ncbi:MAG: hypothetical protein ACPGOY_04740 [Rhodospirillaceae bacterium]
MVLRLGTASRETTNTTSGTYSLNGVNTSGYQSFVAAVGSGNQTIVTVSDDTDREVFVGTVTAGSPDTISRDVLIYSSTGSWITWPATEKVITGVAAGEYLPVFQAEPTNDDVGKLLMVNSAGAGGGLETVPMPQENPLINSDFLIHQRVNAATVSGTYPADRWIVTATGSSFNSARVGFTVGQTDVPGNPAAFLRTVVTSVAGAGNYVILSQRIDATDSLSGETVTLSFYAKSDAPRNLAIEFHQHFGAGGSTDVQGIGAQLVALTTTWKRHTATITIPDVSGKSFGTNPYLSLLFWFDADSQFDARTASLGQQSGTFDIADVQIDRGTVATPYRRESKERNIARCQRYFFKTQPETVAPANGLSDYSLAVISITTNAANAQVFDNYCFPVQMRVAPTITTYNPRPGGAAGQWTTSGADLANVAALSTPDKVFLYNGGVGAPTSAFYHIHFSANAEF